MPLVPLAWSSNSPDLSHRRPLVVPFLPLYVFERFHDFLLSGETASNEMVHLEINGRIVALKNRNKETITFGNFCELTGLQTVQIVKTPPEIRTGRGKRRITACIWIDRSIDHGIYIYRSQNNHRRRSKPDEICPSGRNVSAVGEGWSCHEPISERY